MIKDINNKDLKIFTIVLDKIKNNTAIYRETKE